MITMMECTDCKWCVGFDGDFRILCLHPELPANEVFKYEPLFGKGAEYCLKFERGEHKEYSDKYSQAEDYSMEKYQEISWEGIREWCEQNEKFN